MSRLLRLLLSVTYSGNYREIDMSFALLTKPTSYLSRGGKRYYVGLEESAWRILIDDGNSIRRTTFNEIRGEFESAEAAQENLDLFAEKRGWKVV